jgi:hypothetical protein
MDVSHILVGGLTAISRRNAVSPEQNPSLVDSDEAQPAPQKRDRTRQRR